MAGELLAQRDPGPIGQNNILAFEATAVREDGERDSVRVLECNASVVADSERAIQFRK
jgi:hypothetical protein